MRESSGYDCEGEVSDHPLGDSLAKMIGNDYLIVNNITEQCSDLYVYLTDWIVAKLWLTIKEGRPALLSELDSTQLFSLYRVQGTLLVV